MWFLWVAGRPAYVLQAKADLKQPIRFGPLGDGKEHTMQGALIGQRLFGLPVLEVSKAD